MKHTIFKKITVVLLAAALILSCGTTAFAEKAVPLEEATVSVKSAYETADAVSPAKYGADETVRVSILLEQPSVLEKGHSTRTVATDRRAIAYRQQLRQAQDALAETISQRVLDGKKLDVVWNLTLVGNVISANVRYGDIDAISALPGVKQVAIENQYSPVQDDTSDAEPMMDTSAAMVGTAAAYAEGYTGAGMRIAIIDTGTDTNHQSFDAGAFEYALKQNAEELGLSYDAYLESLELLDEEEIAQKLDQLNVLAKRPRTTAAELYGDTKLAFGFNYVDNDLDITHDNDQKGEHGSHVAGIAAANRYIPSGGTYVSTDESVRMKGVAPDAQIITMKVFGKRGGAYESDYFSAIEDAIVLGCQVGNMSLGSVSSGLVFNQIYHELLERLKDTDFVLCCAAANNGSWADNAANGNGAMYADDVSLTTLSEPAANTTSLAVASVENDGTTGYLFEADGKYYGYTEPNYSNRPLYLLDKTGKGTQYTFLYFDNTAVDGNNLSLLTEYKDVIKGNIVFCLRGTSTFALKHTAVSDAGGAACVVVNNEAGTFNMDLTNSSATIPCVGLLQKDGETIKAFAEPVYADDGTTVLYYKGTLTVNSTTNSIQYETGYYTMSDFSSWGTVGTLELKPEITAPGGNIYSVNGADPMGKGYETMSGTSMATPQVTGLSALLAQYFDKNPETLERSGLTYRQLTHSLLMSTASALTDKDGNYYSVLQQGAGLANIDSAMHADSFITVDGQPDGKVKAELGDDPGKKGTYSFTFELHNLTDEETEYTLSADVFSQDAFFEDALLLSEQTRALASNVTFTVDGKTYQPQDADKLPDVNADGLTNTADAEAILAYVLDNTKEIDAERADLDGDDKVTTYDAHLYLKLLSQTKLLLPANGSRTVKVTIKLTNTAKAFLNYYFANGTYVQAFIHAAEASTDEGICGTAHSVPMLAFYGNWTDASMYDVGSYEEYLSGTETRLPYLTDDGNQLNQKSNYITLKYSGDSAEYLPYGNPIADDAVYDASRNAINLQRGDRLTKFIFSPIRNAGGSLLQVENADTGEVYYREDMGSIYAAFYNEGWVNSTYQAFFSWDGKDSSGSLLADGTRVRFVLALAPEYYADEDNTYDWDRLTDGVLGDGAYLTYTTTVDSVAPVLTNAVQNEEEGTLTVLASDDNYLAAVALYLRGSDTPMQLQQPTQTEAGSEAVCTFDISSLQPGTEYYIAAFDYAKNQTVCRFKLGASGTGGSITEITFKEPEAAVLRGDTVRLEVDCEPWMYEDAIVWSSADEGIATVSPDGIVTGIAEGETVIRAASKNDPAVFAECPLKVVVIRTELNAVLWDEDAARWLTSFNTEDIPAYEKLNEEPLPMELESISWLNGKLYGATLTNTTELQASALYEIDPETLEMQHIGTVQNIFYTDLAPAPHLDNGLLLGIYGPYLMMIDPASGAIKGMWEYLKGGSLFSAIAYVNSGYNPDNNVIMDTYMLIDNEGNVYYDAVCKLDDETYIYVGGQSEALVGSFECSAAWYYNSAYYCHEDGNLYWSRYQPSGTTAELRFFNPFETGMSGVLGSFDDGVWPVSGLFERDYDPTSAPLATDLRFDSFDPANAAVPGTSDLRSVEEAPAETVSYTFGADNTTNGYTEIRYDTEALTLQSVTPTGRALTEIRQEDGCVSVAFAAADAISGPVAELTFTFAPETERTELTLLALENGSDFTSKVQTVALESPQSKPCDGGDDCPQNGFTDRVAADNWAHAAIDFVIERGLMGSTKTDALTFEPATKVSRAMVASILYRIGADGAKVTYTGRFRDVPAGMWFTDAIEWCAENGLCAGKGDGSFDPNGNVTRQELAVFMYNLADFLGRDVSGKTELKSFADAALVPLWSAPYLQWAVDAGIISGQATGDALFLNPTAGAMRSELAAVLLRFFN